LSETELLDDVLLEVTVVGILDNDGWEQVLNDSSKEW
jgi:hypothetical protein